MRPFGMSARVALARPRPLFGARDEARAIDRLAWPINADGIFAIVVELGNTALLGWLGTATLAGVGAAALLVQLCVALLAAVSVSGMILTARAHGAKDQRLAGQIASQSLLTNAGAGVLCALPALLFAGPLLAVTGASGTVADQGTLYLRLVALSFPALGVLSAGTAVMRGAGNGRAPTVTTVLTNLATVALSVGLIVGYPALGVAAAAIGALCARVGGAILVVVLMRRSGGLIGARWRPDGALIGRLTRLGLPATGEQVILALGMLVYGALTLRVGETAYAAQRIALILFGIVWIPVGGYGTAATTLVAQALGGADPARARRLVNAASGRATAWMALLAIGCLVFADPLAGFFTSDPAVRSAAAAGLRVLCLAQPLWAVGQIYAAGLRGTGDSQFPMWAAAAGFWVVRLPLTWLCGLVLGLGLPGICIANGVDAGIRAFLVARRFGRQWTAA